MPQDNFITYHIKETNRRLETIEGKLDVLIGLRAQAKLIAFVIAAITSGIITFIIEKTL